MKSESDGHFCSNCRAELPPGAEVCPACGVFSGEMFDGKTEVQKQAMYRSIVRITVLVMVLAAVAAAAFYLRDSPYAKRLLSREEVPSPALPTRVVKGRPGGEHRARGAVLTESEAVRILRRELTSTGEKPIKNQCLAILSNGSSGGFYIFTAVDSCERTRLGKWRVNGKTEEVSRAR